MRYAKAPEKHYLLIMRALAHRSTTAIQGRGVSFARKSVQDAVLCDSLTQNQGKQNPWSRLPSASGARKIGQVPGAETVGVS